MFNALFSNSHVFYYYNKHKQTNKPTTESELPKAERVTLWKSVVQEQTKKKIHTTMHHSHSPAFPITSMIFAHQLDTVREDKKSFLLSQETKSLYIMHVAI